MKIFETNISLDSSVNSVGSNKAHLNLQLYPSLVIPQKGNYFLKLNNGSIPMIVPNFSVTDNNNVIFYTVDGGVTPKLITFPTGIYNQYDILNYIQYKLKENGDYETDADSGQIIYPFSLTVNPPDGRSYLIINTEFSGYLLVTVSLSNVADTGLFYLRYGFTAASHTLDGAVATTLISSNAANIYDSKFFIRCNICESRGATGEYNERFLYIGNLNGERGGQLFFESGNKEIYGKIRNGQTIRNIEIEFLNRNLGYLDFSNDASQDANPFLNLHIFYYD